MKYKKKKWKKRSFIIQTQIIYKTNKFLDSLKKIKNIKISK